MSKSRALIIAAVMLLAFAGGAALLIRPPDGQGARRALFAGLVLGTLLPFALHAHQIYESLTVVAPGAGLSFGRHPALDRFLAAVWILAIGLSALGWPLSRRAPMAAAAIPALMALVYLGYLLPHALRDADPGTSPTASATSWLVGITIVGCAALAAASRLRVAPS